MYFLNGDRIYIKPRDDLASLNEQLTDCLEQVEQINAGMKIFKLNFFADTSSYEAYQRMQLEIEDMVFDKLQTPVVFSIISQSPLTCQVLVEAFYYDVSLWKSFFLTERNGQAMLFKRGNAEVLAGNVQARFHTSCRMNAEQAFASVKGFLERVNFPVNSIVRQWNYIENILGQDDDKQRYQEFNNVRSDFYAGHFNETGYPAATGIGMDHGGIIIEFVAISYGKATTLSLDNPWQIAAHDYSNKVLAGGGFSERSTPKFERARYLELFGRKLVLISGTASIRGEQTVGIGDPVEQTKVTIQNITRLYSPEVLSQISENELQPRYGHARVYVKNRQDFPVIERTFKRYYGNLPVVYLVADICREDLLVEIEGKVILE